MSKKNCGHYSGIGGQAVLEGVMMKNKKRKIYRDSVGQQADKAAFYQRGF